MHRRPSRTSLGCGLGCGHVVKAFATLDTCSVGAVLRDVVRLFLSAAKAHGLDGRLGGSGDANLAGGPAHVGMVAR